MTLIVYPPSNAHRTGVFGPITSIAARVIAWKKLGVKLQSPSRSPIAASNPQLIISRSGL